jgi:hypothetical protein
VLIMQANPAKSHRAPAAAQPRQTNDDAWFDHAKGSGQ